MKEGKDKEKTKKVKSKSTRSAKSRKSETAQGKSSQKATKLTDEEFIKRLQDQLMARPVREFVLEFLSTLSMLAYIRMGVYQEKDKVDLNQARLAIDCYSSLTEQLKSHLSSSEKEQVIATLDSLRFSFVKYSNKKS